MTNYVNTTPNSLGNKNDNNISAKYRGIHPSYIGRIDINVCGNSDPGTSGIVTPFCKTDGLYFNGDYEPEDFKFNLEKDRREYDQTRSSKLIVDVGQDSIEDYFKAMEYFQKVNSGMTIKTIKFEDPDKYYIRINLDDTDEDI